MTLQLLLTIISVVIGVLLASAVVIFAYITGKASVKNQPDKALVLLNTGNNTRTFKADYIVESNRGYLYRFGKRLVAVPKQYKEVYHKGRRLIFMNRANQIVSSPFDDDSSLSEVEKASLIYELVECDIGSESVRAMRGKQTPKLLLIAAICIAVGAIAVYSIMYFQDKMNTPAPAPQEQTQQDREPEIIDNTRVIEVK